jgi:hypothetical protein
MKKYLVCISILLCYDNKAQTCTPLNTNPTFATINSGIVCNQNSCSGPTCAANWFTSHGSPDILGSGTGGDPINNDVNNYALMWASPSTSAQSLGEGLYSNFSFASRKAYRVRISYASDLSASYAGFRVFATTGLSGAASTNALTCHTSPSPITMQQIGIDQVSIGSSGIANLEFLANANYSQIWIYPFYTIYDGTHQQITWTVDYVNIDTCVSPLCFTSLIYNNGTLPVGTTQGTVFNIGSTAGTGGFGIVQNDPYNYTSIEASQEINLLPEFMASLEPDLFENWEFNAKIIPCSTGGSQSRALSQQVFTGLYPGYKSQVLDSSSYNAPALAEQGFTVFPNPVTTKTNLLLVPKESGTFNILVMNSLGVIVQNLTHNVSSKVGKQQVELDLSKLSAGVYIVQVKNKNGTTLSKKIIKL